MPTPKVFQIGFNKCATRSLFGFFRANKYPALHWEKGALAIDLHDAHQSNRKPLDAFADCVFFSDMECVHRRNRPAIQGCRYFAFLDAHYPDARFILNTRDREDWIRSRIKHGNGIYVADYMRSYGTDDLEEVVARWRAEWDEHHSAVRTYFEDKPGRLVGFHIDVDGPDKIAAALAPTVALDPKRWPHFGKTGARQPAGT